MSMLEKLLLPEIRELIHGKDLETLGETLNRWLPADLADLLSDLGPHEDIVAFGVLTPELAAATFAYLRRIMQVELLRTLPESELARVLNELAPDDRTKLLEDLPDEEVERLLTLLTPEHQRVARSLLSYGVGTVGRLMTPDFIGVEESWTMPQVLAHVRKVGKDSETLNAVYVTDGQQHLIDDIRMREVLLAPGDAIVRDLMDRQFVALAVTDAEATAVALFRKYDRTVLPVIDRRGQLLGVVTVDDVLDIQEEEATREIQKFGGLEALEEPYVATPLLEMVRKRATWLVILFLGELLTASAMGYYEREIARAVVLALFIPLIISSGGNSGSQAATLIVRALAVGEVKLFDWLMVLRRELFSGFTLGVVLGTIGFLRIALWTFLHHHSPWPSFFPSYGEHWALVGLTVGLSLVGIVLWGTISGAMLPFMLKRLGLDPATSSAPFVATLVDVTGLVIYFTVASVILRNTLLKSGNEPEKPEKAEKDTAFVQRLNPTSPSSTVAGAARPPRVDVRGDLEVAATNPPCPSPNRFASPPASSPSRATSRITERGSSIRSPKPPAIRPMWLTSPRQHFPAMQASTFPTQRTSTGTLCNRRPATSWRPPSGISCG
jgi:magnesium transporter